MEPEEAIRITKYNMRRRYKKPTLSMTVKTKSNEFFLEILVQKYMFNLSLFLKTQALFDQLNDCLSRFALKKSDKDKIAYDVYIQRNVFMECLNYLELKDRHQLMRLMPRIINQLECRVRFLEREEMKRPISTEKKTNKNWQFTKRKFQQLLQIDYDIDTSETFNQLHQRVQSAREIPLMRTTEQLKFSGLKKKYSVYYQRLSNMKHRSKPTSTGMVKGMTSMYVVRTDLETTINGELHNIVKVGKTDKSIFDYERQLHEDYCKKILFEHVYLGIFKKPESGDDIDNYFHDRLTAIPNSKYFIFNYTEFESNTKVSQQFYILTEEFVSEMEKLLQNY